MNLAPDAQCLLQSMSINFTNKVVHKSTSAQNKKLLPTFMLTLNDIYQIKRRKSFDTKAVHKMLVKLNTDI